MRPDDLTSARHRHDDVESRLRAALDHRAQAASPQYRLDAILDQARTNPQRGLGSPTWWTLGLVAAALVLALAIVVPGLLGGSGSDPALPATTPTPSESAPTEAPTATPSASASPTTTSSATGTQSPVDTADPTLAALPAYHPAHIGDDLHSIRLYREWVNVDGVLRTDPVEERLEAAVRAALSGYAPNTDGYLGYWRDVSLDTVAVEPDRITIRLSAPGPSDVSDEEARISVQQLVWTAQAAVGEGTIPVRFEISDGSTQLFGRLPTGRDYNRPASRDLYYEDLAPIWITSPTREQVVDGGDVVVSGEATLFEGTYQWELIADTGAVLRSDYGQASEGGPGRGTFEIGLGTLEPGHYTIRVYELSMEDGTTVHAEQKIGFTVR